MSNEQKKPFRFSATQVGLTYSQVGDAIPSRQSLLGSLQSIDDCICEYLIASENHADGGQHYHVYLRFAVKRNIKNPRHWDINGCHPNIRRILSAASWLRYCRKEDHSPLESQNLPGKQRSYIDLALAGDRDGAEREFRAAHSKDYLLNFDRVRENIARLGTKAETLEFDLASYPEAVSIQASWIAKTTLILSGKTGTGKTGLARALGMDYCPAGICFVRHRDALKQYKPDQCIVFDDFHFDGWVREEVLHLLDCNNEGQINVKHSMVRIPPGTPRILTTNRSFDELFAFGGADAVRRRVSWYDCPNQLFAINLD